MLILIKHQLLDIIIYRLSPERRLDNEFKEQSESIDDLDHHQNVCRFFPLGRADTIQKRILNHRIY